MDKQLIERIALEVAHAINVERGCATYVLESTATKFATHFLARIDAERGRPALGYDAIFKSIASATKAPGAPAGIEVSVRAFKEAIGGEIFLSPTIPEGMALVKEGSIREAFIAGFCSVVTYNDAVVVDQDRLADEYAAAQGERNAD